MNTNTKNTMTYIFDLFYKIQKWLSEQSYLGYPDLTEELFRNNTQVYRLELRDGVPSIVFCSENMVVHIYGTDIKIKYLSSHKELVILAETISMNWLEIKEKYNSVISKAKEAVDNELRSLNPSYLLNIKKALANEDYWAPLTDDTKLVLPVKDGNIFSGLTDALNAPVVVCHQVNCKGVMGAGIAKEIRLYYPEVYKEYRRYCDSITEEKLLGKCLLVKVRENLYVANLFGQKGYGREQRYTDYNAIENAFKNLSVMLTEKNLVHAEIRIPYKIGCGLAGGDWNIVEKTICSTLIKNKLNVTAWRLINV